MFYLAHLPPAGSQLLAFQQDESAHLYVYVPNTKSFHRSEAVTTDFFIDQEMVFEPVSSARAREAITAGVGALDSRTKREWIAAYRADPAPLPVPQVLGAD